MSNCTHWHRPVNFPTVDDLGVRICSQRKKGGRRSQTRSEISRRRCACSTAESRTLTLHRACSSPMKWIRLFPRPPRPSKYNAQRHHANIVHKILSAMPVLALATPRPSRWDRTSPGIRPPSEALFALHPDYRLRLERQSLRSGIIPLQATWGE